MEASRSLQRPVMADAAFDRLVRAHRAPLERYVRGLGASREDAEEIAATALLRAYQNPPAAHRDPEWRAWLSTVARNVWIDARRRRELRLVTADGMLESVSSRSAPVDQIAATAEEARQICAAIALLPTKQRAAIYLREVRGLSYGEIAAHLGITLMAVTAILQRARDNVKQRRGGISGALSALAFSPLALLRRGAGSAGSAGAFGGVAVKFAVPVVLLAGAGGAAIVTHGPATGARQHASATATRASSSTGAAVPARRASLTAPAPFVIHPPALAPAMSQPSGQPLAQHLAETLPGPPSGGAGTTTNAGVPVGAPVSASTGAEPAVEPSAPAAPTHNARNAAAQHARNPRPGNARDSAPGQLRDVGGKHAATRPATAAAPSSHSLTAAQNKPATGTRGAVAAPAANGSAHRASSAPAAPPSPGSATGPAAQSSSAAGSHASNAGGAAAPTGSAGASTPNGSAGAPTPNGSTGAPTPSGSTGAAAPSTSAGAPTPNGSTGAAAPPQTPAADPPNAHASGQTQG
ncbi:MAG: hypothetical protein QOH00_2748 [Gaiellales bacterium]|nr:hypothetical protein [Gaiellales bacterium]